jgi:hypothetical protein
MLLAWADDINAQNQIMTLKTRDEIEAFLNIQSDVIFIVDQVNALKTSDDPREEAPGSSLDGWLSRFTLPHKSVYGSSANDTNFHIMFTTRNQYSMLSSYGGFTKVSHLKLVLQ